MKVYRIIVIVVAIILGISYTVVNIFSPAALAAIIEPVTEDYYKFLKENALKVAKTLDKNVLKDETLTADFYFSEDGLVITVESIKAKITAKIPISNHSLNIEDRTIKVQGTADFENVEYEEKNKLEPALRYIIMSIGVGGFTAGMVYILFFEVWFSSKKDK